MGKIYFLVGTHNLLIEKKLKELTKKSTILSLADENFFFHLQKNLNQKLIGENEDLIIKNLERLKRADYQKIALLLENIKFNIFFITKSEPVDFISFLMKNSIKFEIINIVPPKDYSIFLKEYLKKHGIKLSERIIEFLKENYSDHLDFLIQDLNKLVYFKEDLNEKNVFQLFNLHPQLFKIHDYFLEKNWPLFIHSFKKFILEDKSPNKTASLRLLSLIFNSLLKIYLIKNFKNIKIDGHYYYLQKLKEKSKNLTNEEIKKMVNSLARSERKLKKFYLNIKELPEEIYLNYLI